MTNFDPNDDPLARLTAIHRRWRDYPGSAPGGSGLTGLMSTDSAGWDRQQRENAEALAFERELQGQAPRTVIHAQSRGENFMSPGIADQPDWWLQGEPDPQTVTAQNLPRIRQNLDMMPASLRSLYAERFRRTK